MGERQRATLIASSRNREWWVSVPIAVRVSHSLIRPLKTLSLRNAD
jgi:hypothetical protein